MVEKKAICFFFKVLLVLLWITTIGCLQSTIIRKGDGVIEQPGIYRIIPLGKDWTLKPLELRKYTSEGISYIRELLFFRCHPVQSIDVIRMDYSRAAPLFFTPLKSLNNALPDSFEMVALYSFEYLYQTWKDEYHIEKISHQKLSLSSGYEAIEVIYKSQQQYLSSCEKDAKEEKKELKEKIVFIKRGQWGYSTSDLVFYKKHPMIIVLLYVSPIESYGEGIGEFDKMIENFRFI